MKTKEELNALREEVKALNAKLKELSEEELAQVTGGVTTPFNAPTGKGNNPFSQSFIIEDDETLHNYHIYDNNVEKDFGQKPGK